MKRVKAKPPKLPTIAYLQVVLMPNGEIISIGQTIGQFKDFKKVIFEPGKGK